MSGAAVAARPAAAADAPPPPAALLPLLRELNDLKRVRSAGRAGSVAERLFREGWARLADGHEPAGAMRATAAAALAAARLGDLDAPTLAAVGVEPAAALSIRRRALAEVAPDLAPALSPGLDAPAPRGDAPPFVARLADQPRAGVTCPGRPRLVLEPPENHAEHCLMVAVYGVVLAPHYGADAPTVFLASMAHHLHNALIPDAGFTGEVLLGEHLEPAFARATELALAELAPALRQAAIGARRVLPDADTPEGRAFHAADTLDRVLQIEQYLRAGQTTMGFVLGDMALVHEGPVKGFQDRVLAGVGLLP